MKNYFLYAEDDQDDMQLLCEILKLNKAPVEVICVGDGFEVLNHLQQVKQNDPYPSLIILDMKLPKLDGLETLKLLKTDDFYRIIPVIIFSSSVYPADKAACIALGADVLEKPSNYTAWNKILTHLSTYTDEAL